jgi:hypothetical protein
MQTLWCWRCKMQIPMLDEEEFKRVTSKHGPKEGDTRASIIERFHGPVLREYERLTGLHETNPNAVYHHRLSLYGPPCSNCDRPLRTPRARFCAACGWKRITELNSAG